MPRKSATKTMQPTPRQLACRQNARKGGLARAKNNSAAKRKKWSSKGGKRTAELHGTDLFVYITSKRKHVGRYRKPVAQKKKKVAA